MDFTFAFNTTIIRLKLTDIYLYYVAQGFLPPPYRMFITEASYQTGLRSVGNYERCVIISFFVHTILGPFDLNLNLAFESTKLTVLA